MRFWRRSKPRAEGRRIRVSAAGGWYLSLTCLLGIAAVNTGNNVLYLITSFLLGGMCLSGLLSENAVRSAETRWIRGEARAGVPARDAVEVRNRGRLPLFCLEVGEWREGKFQALRFIPFLPPGKRAEIAVPRLFPDRGVWSWDGVAVSTRFPFGLTTKTRWIRSPGSRVVWPAPSGELENAAVAARSPSPSGSGDRIEGELRALRPEEDHREVVWALSELRGFPLARVRGRATDDETHAEIDLRVEAGPAFELRVARAAEGLFRAGKNSPCRLRVRSLAGTDHVVGRERALDRLASARAEGRSAP